MEIKLNPYTPGAGLKPSFLAGRDNLLAESEKALIYIKNSRPYQSTMYYGLRGVGKTVLLNAIEEKCETLEMLYEHIEISEHDNFQKVIASYVRKILLRISLFEKAMDKVKKTLGILKAFTLSIPDIGDIKIDVDAIPGVADSGIFQNDLTEILVNLGVTAEESGKQICLFFDEIQYLQEGDFEALIAAIHRISQKNLPIIVFGAGLPKIAKMAGEAKSYSERLFDFIPVVNLDKPNAIKALTEPAGKQGVKYTEEAIEAIIAETEGYPYFLQEFGKQAWEVMRNDVIDIKTIEIASPIFTRILDQSFFKVRYDRATTGEKEFMYVMAQLSNGPYEISQVAKQLGKEVNSISPIRARLIHKGFVYATDHGQIDFTVPQFNRYLTRIRGQG